MPKSKLFQTDFSISKKLENDIKDLLKLEKDEIKAISDWLQEADISEGMSDEDISLMSAKLGKPGAEISKLGALSIYLSNRLNEYKDNAENVSDDISQTLDLNDNQAQKMRFYLQNLSSVTPRIQRARRFALTETAILPVLTKGNFSVELRAVESERYSPSLYEKPTDWRIEIEDFAVVGLVSLYTHKDDKNDSIVFQLNTQALEQLIKGLEALKLEMEHVEKKYRGKEK